MAKLITPEHIDQISPIASLTKRELNVLDLMVQDNSNPEIAETLFIGVSTVKTHVSNILSKLNVDSRKEAIKKAQSAKLG
jgi:ATP/maltotriose-dependent transcriptional regulator MalT